MTNLTLEEKQELIRMALAAREKAYAPYSNFMVGAALRAEDGRIFTGCNVENASYGLCVCGERNAIFHAACAGERVMTELCVVADTSGPVSPCGACRQVMREFGIQTVILANMKGDFKITTVEELLPYGFEL